MNRKQATGVTFATMAALAFGAFAQSADLLKKQLAGLDRTNVYRRSAGLAELTIDEKLTRAAQGHAEYIDQTRMIGHLQDKARPGFTGKDPAARATAAGYRWMVIMENVAGVPDPTRAVDSAMASVYHRLPLINHEVRDVGFGFSPKATVTMFGLAAKDYVIICPGDNTTGVPPAWTAQEFPNPLPMDVKLPVGCPVSISFPAAKRVELMSATLENVAGATIDCVALTPQTDPHNVLKHDLFLIPRKPLDDRNTYKASFTARVDDVVRSRTWFFVTGSK